MLLECSGKDVMNIQTQRPFPSHLENLNSPHRDSIVRITYVPKVSKRDEVETYDHGTGRYVTMSKEGMICFWSPHLKLLAEHKIEPQAANTKSVWVTDLIMMTSANLIAVSTTARSIIFFDISANRFNRVSYISGLHSCTTTMHYSGKNFIDLYKLLLDKINSILKPIWYLDNYCNCRFAQYHFTDFHS